MSRDVETIAEGQQSVYWTLFSWSADLLSLPDLLSHQIGQIPILLHAPSLLPPLPSSPLQLPFLLLSLTLPLPQWGASIDLGRPAVVAKIPQKQEPGLQNPFFGNALGLPPTPNAP